MSQDPMDGPGLVGQLAGAEREQFLRLRHAWRARVVPVDEAERMATDALAAQVWRGHRLDALEERVMTALLEGRPLGGLPSPGLLVRWRARLERDRRLVEGQCNQVRDLRPQSLKLPGLNPERLEWLARKMRARRAGLEAERAAAPPRGLDQAEAARPPTEPPRPAAPPPAPEPAAPEPAACGASVPGASLAGPAVPEPPAAERPVAEPSPPTPAGAPTAAPPVAATRETRAAGPVAAAAPALPPEAARPAAQGPPAAAAA